MNTLYKIAVLIIGLLAPLPLAHAAYTPFNTNVLGNIGIGSASPGQRLDVVGTIRATAFIGDGSGLINLPSSGWILGASNVGISTINNVGIGTNLTTTAGLTVMNGNVGIGTWVPSQMLDVNGNVAAEGSFYYGFGSNSYVELSNSAGAFLTTGSTYAFVNTNNITFHAGSDAFTIFDTSYVNGLNGVESSYNVGIGTFASNGGLVVMPSQFTSGNVGIGTWIPDSGALIIANGAGNVGIGTIRPGKTLDVNGTVRATAFVGDGSGLINLPAASTGWTLGASNVGISTTNNVGIGTSLTDNAGLTVMNGNVGIGTWKPTATFELSGSGAGLPTVSFLNTSVATGFTSGGQFTQKTGGISTGTSGSGGMSISGWSGAGNASGLLLSGFIGSTGPNSGIPAVMISGAQRQGGSFGFLQASNPILEVDNQPYGSTGYASFLDVMGSGNVGIGSTNPGKTLDVNGTVRATAFIGDGSGLINLPAASTGWTLGASNVGISTTNNVGIGTNLTTTAGLTVMAGNVGIGTWVPIGNLDLLSSNHSSGPIQSFLNTGMTVPYAQANEIGKISMAEVNLGGLAVEGWSAFGVVGLKMTGHIGSAAPPAGVPAVVISGTEQGGSGSALGANNPILQVNNNDYDFSNTNPVFVIMGGSGNVGIGTVIPGNKLAVNGGVGIGTSRSSNFLDMAAPAGGLIVEKNVGIGSSAPGQALDVLGTVRATYFVGDGSGLSGVGGSSNWTYSSSGNVGLSTTANVGVGTSFVSAAGLTVMNGNVGIGTWVPVSRLEVSTSGTLNQVGISMTNPALNHGVTNFAPTNVYGQLNQMNGSGLSVLGISNGGNATALNIVGIRGAGGSGAISTIIAAGKQNGVGMQEMSGSEIALEIRDGNTPVIDLTGTNNVGIGTTTPVGGTSIMNGNVGIGTWIPAQSLDIVGTVRATAFVGDGSGLINLPASGGSSNWTYSSSGNIGLSTTANVGIGTSFVGGTGEGALAVMTGNVGIGTWTPGASLDVYGGLIGYPSAIFRSPGYASIEVLTPFSGSGSSIFLGFNGAETDAGMTLNSASGVLGFKNGNVDNRMVIDFAGNVGIGTITPAGGLAVMNGNVGIGTWVPAQSLDVVGTVRATAFVGDGSGLINLPASGGASGWTLGASNVGISTTNNVGIGTTFVGGAGEGALTVMNGNVGIGTWVPRSPLDVYRTYSGGDPTATFRSDAAASIEVLTPGSGSFSSVYLGYIGAENSFGMEYDSTNHRLGFKTGNVQNRMMIDLNGNVGIGTVTPVGGLAIMNGNVGIGTWVPTTTFAISDGTHNVLSFDALGAANGHVFQVHAPNDGPWLTGFYNDTVSTSIPIFEYYGINHDGFPTFALSGDFEMGTPSSNKIMIYTGGYQHPRLTIDGGGNVGIGTTMPREALEISNTLAFSSVVDNGNSGASATINWNTGNYQKIVLNSNTTLSFTAPAGVLRLSLKLTQDGTGSRTVTWPGSVKWAGGAAPTLSTAASAVDFVSCVYDGSYYCVGSLNFQ